MSRVGMCLARHGDCLGRFVLSFLLPCLWRAFSLATLLRCGVCGGGLFLAYRVVLPMVGVSRVLRVFVAGAVGACVATTLNLKINFRSGFWVGCPLCFAVVAAGIVFVALLACGWGCMVGVVWPWRSAWRSGGCFAAVWWWECERDAFGGPCAGLGTGLMGRGTWV